MRCLFLVPCLVLAVEDILDFEHTRPNQFSRVKWLDKPDQIPGQGVQLSAIIIFWLIDFSKKLSFKRKVFLSRRLIVSPYLSFASKSRSFRSLNFSSIVRLGLTVTLLVNKIRQKVQKTPKYQPESVARQMISRWDQVPQLAVTNVKFRLLRALTKR